MKTCREGAYTKMKILYRDPAITWNYLDKACRRGFSITTISKDFIAAKLDNGRTLRSSIMFPIQYLLANTTKSFNYVSSHSCTYLFFYFNHRIHDPIDRQNSTSSFPTYYRDVFIQTELKSGRRYRSWHQIYVAPTNCYEHLDWTQLCLKFRITTRGFRTYYLPTQPQPPRRCW